MRCEVAREALSARVDGERETVPSARVDEHVAGCAECTAFFEALQTMALPEIREPLRVIPDDDGPDLVEQMLAARELAQAAEPATSTRPFAWWIAASAGACCSGVLAVALVLTGGAAIVWAVFVSALVATLALTLRARR